MEQVFFKNIQHTLISELQQASKSIQIAVCWFTNKAIFDILAQKASEGVRISLMLLDDYANKRKEALPLNDLIGLGAKIYFSDKTAPMHHKFCVIDGTTVLTGSYDWTYFSESKALENLLLIKENPDMAQAFISEFELLASVLSPVSEVVAYTMAEGLVKDTFGLKNYLSEDVYLQALKADENGEDLNALNLMHHSAQIDEYKIEEQTEFIKEKTTAPVETENSDTESVKNEQVTANEIENQEEEETEKTPTPVYTSRGIGFTPTPVPVPEEEVHEETPTENVEATYQEIPQDTQQETPYTESQQETFAETVEATATVETNISTEQPVENQENNSITEVISEVPSEIPASTEFVPNPEAESMVQQGEAAYQQGRLDDAIQFFTQAVMIQANHSKAYLNLAIVKWRQGRFSEQAEFAAQSVQHDPTNSKAFNTLALAQDKMGNFVDAINNYTKALELSPDNYSYLWNRAVALKQVGRRQEAVVDFGKVVKLCNQVVMSNPTNQNAKMTMEAAMKEMGS